MHSSNNNTITVRLPCGGGGDKIPGPREDQGRIQTRSFAHSLGTEDTEINETQPVSCHHPAGCVQSGNILRPPGGSEKVKEEAVPG